MNESILQVNGLKTHFFTEDGVVPAVDGVDFSIKMGETLGIVGESGCGKSVTSLSIMRLIKSPPGKIVAGSIMFEGKDLLKLRAQEMREIRGKDISMIFQEPMTSLNPVYTIGNQITEVLRSHKKISKKDAEEQAINVLKKVSIPRAEEIMKAYPFSLSGGMRQRVMIAMALACDPKILIADEPTTALDVTIQAQILELMKDLQKQTNTAVMIITHDLGVIAEMAKNVIVMYAGRIIEQAPVLDIFDDPRHPYTIGLHKSAPSLTVEKSRLECIKGMVPNLLKPIKGCAFRPRCDSAMDICAEELPELVNISENHKVRCWLCQNK